MDRGEFIGLIAPIAVGLRVEGSAIFPSVRVAQALLETGAKVPAWNNVFGIKVGDGVRTAYWTGSYVDATTREVIDGQVLDNVTAQWRAYDSVENSVRDHELFLLKPRYASVRNAPTPKAQCDALYAAGYATDAPAEVDGDPSYAEKLWSIIQSNGFTVYDAQAERIKGEISSRLAALEASASTGALRVANLEAMAHLSAVPAWAGDAVNQALGGSLIDTPNGGSYDFYRMLTILQRLGKL